MTGSTRGQNPVCDPVRRDSASIAFPPDSASGSTPYYVIALSPDAYRPSLVVCVSLRHIRTSLRAERRPVAFFPVRLAWASSPRVIYSAPDASRSDIAPATARNLPAPASLRETRTSGLAQVEEPPQTLRFASGRLPVEKRSACSSACTAECVYVRSFVVRRLLSGRDACDGVGPR